MWGRRTKSEFSIQNFLKNANKFTNFCVFIHTQEAFLAGNYMFRVTNRSNSETIETETIETRRSKSTVKTPGRRHRCRFGVFIVNFEQLNIGWVYLFNINNRNLFLRYGISFSTVFVVTLNE